MRRRDFILAGGATVVWPLATRAQEAGRTYRLGMLMPFPRDTPFTLRFLDALRHRGFTESQNLTVDYRVYGLHVDLIPQYAAELVKAEVDVIGVGGGVAIRATQQANGKRQDILIEAVPGLHRMGALANSNATTDAALHALQEAARAHDVELSIHRVAKGEEVVAAIDMARASGATALNVLASPMLYAHRRLIMDRAAVLRLVAIYQWPEIAEEGGLAAYGPRLTQLPDLVARQAANLLRGTKPVDLPVEQPTKFELVINLKTAKALGHTISRVITRPRRRGDRVRRRDIIFAGGAIVMWPLATRAQQSAIPLIGFLSSRSLNDSRHLVDAFRTGLQANGYIEGKNVAVEYRWAEGQYDRLPALAAELVRSRVAVLVTTGGEPSVVAAKAATSSIPIVFTTGGDPVKMGLVASLSRPGGGERYRHQPTDYRAGGKAARYTPRTGAACRRCRRSH